MPAPRARPIKGQPKEEPVTQPPYQAPRASPIPPVERFNGVDPLMIGSLPSIASGADVYARQFYRGSQVPFRRYLPISRQ